MKHYLLITCGVFLTAWGNNANSQDLQVISGGGTYTEDTGGSVAWTVGEVIIITAESSGNHVTQGFHQGNIYVVGVEELVNLDIQVFPNPAAEIVNVYSDAPAFISLYDMSGRLVYSYQLDEPSLSIDVTEFSRGTYSMVFEQTGAETKTVKLIIL